MSQFALVLIRWVITFSITLVGALAVLEENLFAQDAEPHKSVNEIVVDSNRALSYLLEDVGDAVFGIFASGDKKEASQSKLIPIAETSTVPTVWKPTFHRSFSNAERLGLSKYLEGQTEAKKIMDKNYDQNFVRVINKIRYARYGKSILRVKKNLQEHTISHRIHLAQGDLPNLKTADYWQHQIIFNIPNLCNKDLESYVHEVVFSNPEYQCLILGDYRYISVSTASGILDVKNYVVIQFWTREMESKVCPFVPPVFNPQRPWDTEPWYVPRTPENLDISKNAYEIIHDINKKRMSLGLEPLSITADQQKFSSEKLSWMVKTDYLSEVPGFPKHFVFNSPEGIDAKKSTSQLLSVGSSSAELFLRPELKFISIAELKNLDGGNSLVIDVWTQSEAIKFDKFSVPEGLTPPCSNLRSRLEVSEITLSERPQYSYVTDDIAGIDNANSMSLGHDNHGRLERYVTKVTASGGTVVAYMDEKSVIHVLKIGTEHSLQVVRQVQVHGSKRLWDIWADDNEGAVLSLSTGGQGVLSRFNWAAGVVVLAPTALSSLYSGSWPFHMGRITEVNGKLMNYFAVSEFNPSDRRWHEYDTLISVEKSTGAISINWYKGCSHSMDMRLGEYQGKAIPICLSDVFPSPGLHFNHQGGSLPSYGLSGFASNILGFTNARLGGLAHQKSRHALVVRMPIYGSSYVLPRLVFFDFGKDGNFYPQNSSVFDNLQITSNSHITDAKIAPWNEGWLMAHKRQNEPGKLYIREHRLSGEPIGKSYSISSDTSIADDFVTHKNGDIVWAYSPTLTQNGQGSKAKKIILSRLRACE